MLVRRALPPARPLAPLLLARAIHSTRRRTSPSPSALLVYYSQTPTRALTLSDLTKYGAPPLSETDLLESAETTRKELLGGLARRVSLAHVAWVCGAVIRSDGPGSAEGTRGADGPSWRSDGRDDERSRRGGSLFCSSVLSWLQTQRTGQLKAARGDRDAALGVALVSTRRVGSRLLSERIRRSLLHHPRAQ